MFLRKTGALYPWLIMANIYQQFWAAQRMNFAWETAESRGSLVSAILRGWWHSAAPPLKMANLMYGRSTTKSQTENNFYVYQNGHPTDQFVKSWAGNSTFICFLGKLG